MTHASNARAPRGMTRRRFLRGAGAVTVLVAGGGVWRAADRGVFSVSGGPAYAPWTTWRTDEPAGALGLVRAAILAANPHNTQPWLFFVSEDQIVVLADRRRHLGTMDVYLREMHLGLGCAVENLLLAARAQGYRPRLTLYGGMLGEPGAAPEPAPAAQIALTPGDAVGSALYDAIPDRHTNRSPYDTARPVSAEVLAALATRADADPAVRLRLLTTDDDRQAFSTATVAATRAIVADADMVRDSDAWFRHTRRDILQHRDGVTLDSVGLSPIVLAAAKMLPPLSAEAGHAHWLENTEKAHCATAAGFGLLAVRDLYEREQTLRAGRVWQRIHLWATTQGLAMHPLNQLPEVVDRERQLGREPATAAVLATLMGTPGWRPTFAFRFGYPAQPANASPRRPVDEVVA